MRHRFHGYLLISALTALPWHSVQAEPLGFNRDVQPILSDKCFACHGPDSASRKAGLRLDQPEAAMAAGVLSPGNPADSEVVHRIRTDDSGDRMPPPESNLALSAEEADILEQWIAEGAVYEPHWSFIPLKSVSVPVGLTPKDGNPIDAFVLAELSESGFAPAPEADRETLIRRLSLDLRGLPPTLEEIDAFLADTEPGAYLRVVDAFLADPSCAEHLAAGWLDVARYADTFGYQNDVESDLWPWRDWLIRAFDANMPYDEFITEQLAGDLLENPTQDQRLATAFNRLHRQTNEGGSINEEFRVAYVGDRTETFATAFLGLTLGCARCHDHKFDPISQREYYSLTAFFDDIDESGLYSHFTHTAPSPSMLLYDDGQERQHEILQWRIGKREGKVAEAAADAETRFAAFISEGSPIPEAQPANAWSFETMTDGKTPDSADEKADVSSVLGAGLTDGPHGKALALTGDDGAACRQAGDVERSDAFSLALWLKTPAQVPHLVVAHRTVAETDAASRGWELLLEDGKPTFGLNHFWPGNALRVQTKEPIPAETWVHVAATYDGSSTAAGVRIFVNGEAADTVVLRDHLFKTIKYEGGGGAQLLIGHRFRDVGFKGGMVDEFRFYHESLSAIDVRSLATGGDAAALWANASDAERREHYLFHADNAYAEARASLAEARTEESAFAETVRHIMVMRDMDAPREAYVLTRGQYDQRAETVEPGTPDAILPFGDSLPRNRLGLAEWLLDPQNPLTARVAVNRYWQQLFGRGLVETQEDFGLQGRPPSHPELLDFLAKRFMDSGWDVKGLLRFIVASATYRQDSDCEPALREHDPQNVLLARGPSYRLSAEQIRDQALAASGLLVPKIGGPSVKPYQPPGLWKEASQVVYNPDSGEGLYRRSMYTFIKRTVPPPAMLTFDAPNREVCTVRRERTTTPLQALVLLNDPQYVEAARVLAEKSFDATQGDEQALIERVFRLLTGRHPDARQREILAAAYDEHEQWYAAAPEAASAYLDNGEAPRVSEAPAPELAAAAAVAQAIMNFDAFQVKP
ncbi:MAG: DUF1553 domain-containing protein [Candidatus Hydrogenedens sp.]|nr:DUF1553 domain-containing protein [Candidatus Hydrogenedens sp.]